MQIHTVLDGYPFRESDEDASYYDAGSFRRLHEVTQAAVDIALPPGASLTCSPCFQEDQYNEPAKLRVFYRSPEGGAFYSADFTQRQIQYVSAAIMDVFPMQDFFGSTACGRRESKPLTRDPHQSSHDYIEALTVARKIFVARSDIISNSFPPC